MPRPSSEAVGQRFRRQGRRDTRPELLVRRGLHAAGYRFRVDVIPAGPARRSTAADPTP